MDIERRISGMSQRELWSMDRPDEDRAAEVTITVQHRCPNIGRHGSGPGCACHPNIPAPCDDCYAIEVITRRVPYSAFTTFEVQRKARIA